MQVIEGMRRVRKYFPKAQYGPADDGELARRVNDLARMHETETHKEFIRQLDQLGLAVQNNQLVVFRA